MDMKFTQRAGEENNLDSITSGSKWELPPLKAPLYNTNTNLTTGSARCQGGKNTLLDSVAIYTEVNTGPRHLHNKRKLFSQLQETSYNTFLCGGNTNLFIQFITPLILTELG